MERRSSRPMVSPGAIRGWSRLLRMLWESERIMRRQSTWTFALLGGAILALLLLASSISGLSFQPGHFYAISSPQMPAVEPGTALPLDPATLGFWQMILAGIAIVLVIALL